MHRLAQTACTQDACVLQPLCCVCRSKLAVCGDFDGVFRLDRESGARAVESRSDIYDPHAYACGGCIEDGVVKVELEPSKRPSSARNEELRGYLRKSFSGDGVKLEDSLRSLAVTKTRERTADADEATGIMRTEVESRGFVLEALTFESSPRDLEYFDKLVRAVPATDTRYLAPCLMEVRYGEVYVFATTFDRDSDSWVSFGCVGMCWLVLTALTALACLTHATY
jgi:hypothetical protein